MEIFESAQENKAQQCHYNTVVIMALLVYVRQSLFALFK